MSITMTKTYLEKNPNTKTTYIEIKKQVEELTQKQYENITSTDSIQFFKRLGGNEYVQRGYTSKGYLITKLTSTSPDKLNKSVYEFKIS